MTSHRSIFIPERTAEECLWLWPTILIRAPEGSQDWNFAERIAQQAARPGWEPGTLQLIYMRELVNKYCPDGIRLDPDLIEGAFIHWITEPAGEAE